MTIRRLNRTLMSADAAAIGFVAAATDQAQFYDYSNGWHQLIQSGLGSDSGNTFSW
jgi:hypothetical protein